MATVAIFYVLQGDRPWTPTALQKRTSPVALQCAGGGLPVVPRHAGGCGPGDQLDDVAERRQGGPGPVELHPPAHQPLTGKRLNFVTVSVHPLLKMV